MIENVAQFIAPLFLPLGFLWAILLVLALVCFAKKSRGLGGILVSVCLMLSLLGSTPLAFVLIGTLERPYALKTIDAAQPADAIVVLGSGGHFAGNPTLPLEFDSRILTGMELIRHHKSRILLIPQRGQPKHGMKDQQIDNLRDRWQSWNVLADEQLISLDVLSNTHENVLQVLNMARRLHWTRLILVDSAYRLKLEEGLFRQTGLSVDVVASDFIYIGVARPFRSVIPVAEPFLVFQDYVHESTSWYFYRWRGWLSGPR